MTISQLNASLKILYFAHEFWLNFLKLALIKAIWKRKKKTADTQFIILYQGRYLSKEAHKIVQVVQLNKDIVEKTLNLWKILVFYDLSSIDIKKS